MQISTGQQLRYSNHDPLPIEDVADSLLAMKALIEAAPEVFIGLFPTVSIQGLSIYVNEIKSGSLLEDLAVRFVWGNQSKLESDIDSARSQLNVEGLLQNKPLLSCIILALILGGGKYLLEKQNASESQKAILQGNQNNVVIIGSKLTEGDPRILQGIIDSVISKNPSLAKHAVKAVRPAKREDGASIVMEGNPDISISSAAVKAMPSLAPDEEPLEFVEDFKNLEVQIRAWDMDNTKRGWAVIIPSLSEKRSRLHLDPGVKPTDLQGKTKIFADITVVFKLDEKGVLYPGLVLLRRISK